MTTYILHGGYVRHSNESNDAYYRRVIELVPEGGTILFVYFAARNDEGNYEELYTAQKMQMEQFVNGKRLTYVCATPEHFLEEIKNADAVLMRGGSTNTLLETLRTYPDLKNAFEDKVVTGSSAGAYAIAAYNYDKSQRTMRTGLGLLQVRAVCHYQSENEENCVDDDGVTIMNAVHGELPLIVLKDHEWKEFTV